MTNHDPKHTENTVISSPMSLNIDVNEYKVHTNHMFKFYVSFVDKEYLCVEVFGNYIEKVQDKIFSVNYNCLKRSRVHMVMLILSWAWETQGSSSCNASNLIGGSSVLLLSIFTLSLFFTIHHIHGNNFNIELNKQISVFNSSYSFLTNKGASYIMITWQYSSKGCYYG